MTICIAAICQDENNKEVIVFATDHMISHPLGQFDMAVDKYKEINRNTVAMLSGNPLFFDGIIKNCEECNNFNAIAEKVQQNMIDMKTGMIQKQILDIYHIDFTYISENLNTQHQNQFIHTVFDTISKFNLETSILLAGFKEDSAQIIEINETSMDNTKDISFDAIGSGAVQAWNTMLFQGHSKTESLPTAIYNVYKAKRNAEVARGVGKETDIAVLSQSGVTEIDEDKIKVLSKIYDEELGHGKTHKDLNEIV